VSATLSESHGEWSTPEDAAASRTLLRAPAAIAAAFFLGGAILAQAVWSSATPEARTFAALRCLAVSFVCVPFLLPTKQYRPGRTITRVWLVIAASAASLRSIQLVVWLYPLPLGEWLTAAAVQAGLVTILWLAVRVLIRPSA
jgi:hypothetical protein